MDPKMKAVNVSFYYGKKQALKDINVDIKEHEITAFIGPSGSGKTTFLRLLNRMNELVRDTRLEGQLLLDKEDIHRPELEVAELRRKVGMVFQQPNPFPKSIFENVAFGRRMLGMDHDKPLEEVVENSLRAAALWDEVKDDLHRSGLALSGGQQQRLCIARMLAVEPEVILMDEPCSGLDPISTLRIEELMQDLKKQYTIAIVTHNMQQAARASDWTGFFLLGEMLEYGATGEVFSRPRNKKTEDYISGRFG
jgi:phosphate transport system ATP-binding protein